MSATQTKGGGNRWHTKGREADGFQGATRPQVHALATNSVVSFNPEGHAVRIRCDIGLAWVTQPGDGRDVVLRAGQEFVSTGQGKVVVQALEPARLVVSGD